MPNMSYCRWENTFSDLQDCLNSLDELQRHEEMIENESEWKAKKKLLQQILNIVDDAEDELNDMEVFEEEY